MNKIIKKWHGLGVQEKLHILIQGSLIILFFISMEWVIARPIERASSEAASKATLRQRTKGT